MSNSRVELALLGSFLLLASCCPELAPEASGEPLRYPTGLSDSDEAMIEWTATGSTCQRGSTVANAGSLSVILAGMDLVAGGADCEVYSSLQLPRNVYLRSLTTQARGMASVEKGHALAGTLRAQADCGDEATLTEVGRSYQWQASREPGADPGDPTVYDVDLEGTAVMTGAAARMCDGRKHKIKVVTLVSIAGEATAASSASLDSLDLHADVAACSGPRFESMCEWARFAYQRVARTDEVDPPTSAVAETLAVGLEPGAGGPTDPKCTADTPVVRAAAAQRLHSRRAALKPLLEQQCAEHVTVTDSHDLASGEDERQCRARKALEFLGESVEHCGCNR